MARSIQLTIHESQQELEHYLSKQKSATGKERLQMLYWLKRGIAKNRKELAQLLQRNEATISRWLLKYRCGGLAKLLEVKRAHGNRVKIPPTAVAQLQQRLSQPEGFHSYGEAQEWLEQACGVKAAYKTVHKLVRYKLQAKLKVPRPRSIKQHPQALEQFKKTSLYSLKVLQELFGKGKGLRYLCQDESRFGLHTIMGRLLTLKGVKPHGYTQWPRDNFYLYGVVEPLTGETYFYEFSHLDSCCFQLFINQVSQRFADSVVILQMDRGRFHLSRQLDWPENLIPICQPAHCPEQGSD